MKKEEVISERPLILLKKFVKYVHISMDASMDCTWWDEEWHPITDKGVEILGAYLMSLIPYMKTNTWFGAGRYSNVTVRKEIADDVIKNFQSVYAHNHKTITHADLVNSAMSGRWCE